MVTFYTASSKSGVYTTADYANASAGGKFVTASGNWLDQPTGVLRATDGSGNPTSALLSLADPHYDATSKTLTFQAKILPATSEGARLPLKGGATHRLVDDAQNGLASNTLAAPPAAGPLTDAALFIDQNSQQLATVAESSLRR
ncbi:hypothetical protein WJX81_002224 [Elliptochloris bilobata]|uniref:Uncharacterized protein n=1 Tax=Elliptochloris bilobata TaxID=381761 RepID=A0AAW1QL26_9CHLO